MGVKVAGVRLDVSADTVRQKLKGTRPGPIQTHAVVVEGISYPIKEAFALVSGLDVLDFNTNHARSIFQRLGFPVHRMARGLPATQTEGKGR